MSCFGFGGGGGTPYSSGYSQIQDEGIALAPATIIDFVGAGVTASNGVGKTIVNIPSSNKVFTQTSTSLPVANTIVETSIISTGVGSLSVPANGFQVGDSFTAVMTGHINSANNQDIEFRIKSGAVLLADTGLVKLAQTNNEHFTLTIYFTIRAIGTAGVASIATGGSFAYNKDANFSLEGVNFSTENNTTFNTTILNNLNVTVQWANANINNSIYSEIFTLTKTY